jgi:hypothetical protein
MLIEGAVDRQLHGDGLEEGTNSPSHVSELRWRVGKQAPSDERFPLGGLCGFLRKSVRKADGIGR